jgi:hypothetical protein
MLVEKVRGEKRGRGGGGVSCSVRGAIVLSCGSNASIYNCVKCKRQNIGNAVLVSREWTIRSKQVREMPTRGTVIYVAEEELCGSLGIGSRDLMLWSELHRHKRG